MLNRLWYIHIVENYTARRMNELNAVIWMNLTKIIFKDKPHIKEFLHMRTIIKLRTGKSTLWNDEIRIVAAVRRYMGGGAVPGRGNKDTGASSCSGRELMDVLLSL